MRLTPTGSRLAAAAQRARRAGIDMQRAARLERAGDPGLARGGGRRGASGTRCSARPRRRRRADSAPRPSAITMCVPPAAAILPASILVRMPPRESSEAGAAGHGLDLGRDPLDHAGCAALRVLRGRGGIEPVDVGEAARAGRRPSWWRRGRRAGRCRHSGSRLVATVSFSLMTGIARRSSRRPSVARALR